MIPVGNHHQQSGSASACLEINPRTSCQLSGVGGCKAPGRATTAATRALEGRTPAGHRCLQLWLVSSCRLSEPCPQGHLPTMGSMGAAKHQTGRYQPSPIHQRQVSIPTPRQTFEHANQLEGRPDCPRWSQWEKPLQLNRQNPPSVPTQLPCSSRPSMSRVAQWAGPGPGRQESPPGHQAPALITAWRRHSARELC